MLDFSGSTTVYLASYRRKKRPGKKEEDLSSFETMEVVEYKLTGADHYCPDCHKKYKVVTKETVKRLKFIPARFEVMEEVTFVYSCPKCGVMKRPKKMPSLLKDSVATPSLVAGIMNAKYVNGMPLARAPQLAVCEEHTGSTGECDCIQHYGNGNVKWAETIQLSHLCNGEDERSRSISMKGSPAGIAPMIQPFAGGLPQQHQKVRMRFSPGKRRGISYFVKVRKITYLPFSSVPY